MESLGPTAQARPQCCVSCPAPRTLTTAKSTTDTAHRAFLDTEKAREKVASLYLRWAELDKKV